MTQAVILAGGRGERLRPMTDVLPKPMVQVAGQPFLVHLVSQLYSQGVRRVVILGGYLGDLIEQYFENGKSLLPDDLLVSVFLSGADLSPGERLMKARSVLHEEFLLMYGDNYARFSLNGLRKIREETRSTTIFSLSKKCPGNINVDDHGIVSDFSVGKRSANFSRVELGYMLTSRDPLLLDIEKSNGDLNLALSSQVSRGLVAGLDIRHPYFSVSDPNRLGATNTALSKRKVIILDRDGVLNNKPPQGEYVSLPEDLELIRNNWSAIKKMVAKDFSFVIVTNQAGIERGTLPPGNLELIHQIIRSEFESIGGKLLGIYFCPHHWDTGCECRKPKPGLLFQAAEAHHLILDNTMMVGDQISDWQAAREAGSPCILLGDYAESQVPKGDCFQSLSEALPVIESFYDANRLIGFN